MKCIGWDSFSATPETTEELCDICGEPFNYNEVRVGNGDGRGNRFAHKPCWETK